MFIARTYTTTSTTEWAMCELLQNPEQTKKIRPSLLELLEKTKNCKRVTLIIFITCKQLRRKHYAYIPPAPMLLPRKAVRVSTLMGYSVPKNTQLLVNNWAIGRDKDIWENALLFKPERFLNSNISYKGQNYELLPFGDGRRMCPGLSLADHTLPLILGSFTILSGSFVMMGI